jgi:selT/selW/selH-like putative selenoprotein
VTESLALEAAIEPGETGEFTVRSDGELIFSKREAGRFPEHDEVLAKLRATAPR